MTDELLRAEGSLNSDESALATMLLAILDIAAPTRSRSFSRFCAKSQPELARSSCDVT